LDAITVLSYLEVTGLQRGWPINFEETKLVDDIKRISLCPLWLNLF
jgi:hypothetical protein